MCENFVCIKLTGEDHPTGSAKLPLPEPCFEHVNCQICELMYDCDFCASESKCKQSSKSSSKRGGPKNTGKRSH
jgi:hypothetical protein